MTDPDRIVQNLQSRFTWESDGKVDSYHVMANEGPVRGDCDDFATRILYDYSGRNWLKFWWLLVTFQSCFWFVRSPRGGAHLTIWIKGLGYTDNWKNEFTPKEELHDKKYPVLWPIVALKIFIGKFDKT